MKQAKFFINKHSVPAQDAEHSFGHNERVIDINTAKEAVKMAYDNGYKKGYTEGTPTQDEIDDIENEVMRNRTLT